jgi:hypothetical protein
MWHGGFHFLVGFRWLDEWFESAKQVVHRTLMGN